MIRLLFEAPHRRVAILKHRSRTPQRDSAAYCSFFLLLCTLANRNSSLYHVRATLVMLLQGKSVAPGVTATSTAGFPPVAATGAALAASATSCIVCGFWYRWRGGGGGGGGSGGGSGRTTGEEEQVELTVLGSLDWQGL